MYNKHNYTYNIYLSIKNTCVSIILLKSFVEQERENNHLARTLRIKIINRLFNR